MSALKFSRSPYLDTHLSECIHDWTMVTLLDWLSFHAIGPQGPCLWMGLQDQNLVHVQNVVCLR